MSNVAVATAGGGTWLDGFRAVAQPVRRRAPGFGCHRGLQPGAALGCFSAAESGNAAVGSATSASNGAVGSNGCDAPSSFAGLGAGCAAGLLFAGSQRRRRIRRRALTGLDDFKVFHTEDGREFEIFSNEVLGAGAQGTVYRGVYCATGQPVAIKVIPTWRLMLEEGGENKIDSLEMEFMTLRTVGHHENIAGMIAGVDVFCKEGKRLDFPRYKLMVMEIVNGRELAEHVALEGALREPIARHVFVQVMEGLAHMHEKGVIHRDLKPENVLVTGDEITMDSEVKLVDFGVAKCVNNGPLKTVVGTPGYMAPEVARAKMQYVSSPFHSQAGEGDNGAATGAANGSHGQVATFSWGQSGLSTSVASPPAVQADPFGLGLATAAAESTQRRFCPKIDVWSAGVVLYTCLTGKLPFKNMTEIIESDYIRSPLSECSEEAKDLLAGMLEKDPDRRFSMDEVLDHPWMGCSAEDSCTIVLDSEVEELVSSTSDGALAATMG